MNALQDVAVLAAGTAAGAINAVVGSGTLITFPVLLAVGYPAVTANVSNTVGLCPGSVAGAWGYRAHLRGQRSLVVKLATASVTGGIIGAVLLLALPASAFRAVVPVLIGLGCLLVLVQPRLSAYLARRGGGPSDRVGPGLWLGIFAVGIYGGYFGGGQGVLLLGIMGLLLAEPLQRINGIKNILALTANLIGAVIFIAVAHVSWMAALFIAIGSTVGGHLGARYGRRLSPEVLRVVILAVGVATIVRLVA